MIAHRHPRLGVENRHTVDARRPRGRHETEINVPRLRRLEEMPIRRVRFLAVIHLMKHVIRAHKTKIAERRDDRRMTLREARACAEFAAAVEVAKNHRWTSAND